MKKQISTMMACACASLSGCGPAPAPYGTPTDAETLHIFHNNRGDMCLDAVAWLATMQVQYPDLNVEEHLIDDPAEQDLLNQWKSHFDGSQGISTSFGFLPIIFYGGEAFSGFNDQIAQDLETLIASAQTSAP